MPSVLLDNAPVQPHVEAQTVGDVLAALQDEARRGHRLITTVECDGRSMLGDDLTDLLPRSIGSVESLHLHTESQRTLVLAILRQSAAVMAQTQSLRIEIADQLAQGRTAEAMKGLMSFVGVWGQTYSAITQCAAALAIDLDALHIEDETITSHITSVTALLRELKQSLADHDHVRLADQLAYELGPSLDTCGRVLSELISIAESN